MQFAMAVGIGNIKNFKRMAAWHSWIKNMDSY